MTQYDKRAARFPAALAHASPRQRRPYAGLACSRRSSRRMHKAVLRPAWPRLPGAMASPKATPSSEASFTGSFQRLRHDSRLTSNRTIDGEPSRQTHVFTAHKKPLFPGSWTYCVVASYYSALSSSSLFSLNDYIKWLCHRHTLSHYSLGGGNISSYPSRL